MMVVALLSWWYTAGWSRLANQSGKRISLVLENFSVGLLARSLFDPYRQISSEQVQGGLDAKMRALGDRMFSRVFGAVVRSIFIVVGSAGAVAVGVIGWVQIILWPFVPLLPIIGLIVMLTGWLP